MGGLVARSAMADNDTALCVDGLIALATPNHGRDLAGWCALAPWVPPCTDTIKEMETSCPFLRDLNRQTSEDYDRSTTMTWSIAGDGEVYQIGGRADMTWLPKANVNSISCEAVETDGSQPKDLCNDSAGNPGIHRSITRKVTVLDTILSFTNWGVPR